MTDFIANDKQKVVLYTDGGSRAVAGWGIHGYFYTDEVTKSNSGCKKAHPTKKGYINTKTDEKVPVDYYITHYGSLGNVTNNVAELTAMLKAIALIKKTAVQKALILADSQYVLNLLQNRDKYVQMGFKSSTGKELANKFLVMEMFNEFNDAITRCDIELEWIPGHSGNYGNDLADENATIAINRSVNTGEAVEVLTLQTPDDFFGITNENPKMFTEQCLFFTTNNISDNTDNEVYYQGSFGSKTKSKSGEERKQLRGKPFADCCLSVIKLNNPDVVINKLMDKIDGLFDETGVVECNLSNISRESIYDEVASSNIDNFSVDLNKRKISLPNGTELAALINPVRQSFRMIEDFNGILNMLNSMSDEIPPFVDFAVDITDKIYSITEKKDKKTYKPIITDDGYIDVEVTLNGNGVKDKVTTIPVTVGVDLPNKIALGRLKTVNPKVTLLGWNLDSKWVRFCTLIQTDEGYGLWVGIYSNIHLH